MNTRPKKSSASKAQRKSPARPRCRAAKSGGAGVSASSSLQSAPFPEPARREPRPTRLRRESRAWLHTELPTQLERDTFLTPEWVAESVVQEVERFLKADLPAGFAERLAARAYHLYPRNKHFKKALNLPGNGGRDTLYMFMRHWTAGWLNRERSPLYKQLPRSFGQGWPLPVLPQPPRRPFGEIRGDS